MFSNEIPTHSKQNSKPETQRKKLSLRKVSHFMIAERIGKGGFGSVYRAFETFTNSELAVKVIGLQELSAKQIEQLRNEIQVQGNLNHPNIVRIYEAVWTSSKLYIFMELVRGKELFQHIVKNGPMKENSAAKVFQQICSAVKYLHDSGVSHRDIKTENIMIDADLNVKLIDFGFAKKFSSAEDSFMHTICGSPSYTAPEIVERKRYKGKDVDVWCLGVTLYVMLEAALPFDQEGDSKRKDKILRFDWERPINSSLQAIQIYKNVFRPKELRFTLEELLNTAFFTKYQCINDQNLNTDESNVIFSTHNSSLIKDVANFMKMTEQEVRIKLLDKEFGPVFCLYSLLKQKQSDSESFNRTLRMSSLQVRKSEEKEHTDTIFSTKPTDEQKIMSGRVSTPSVTHRTRLSTPKKPIKAKMLPLINDEPAKTSRYRSRQSEDITAPSTIEAIMRKKVGNEILGLKARHPGKKIIFRDLPRLREESPESPRRLIDCIKRYY